MKRTYVYDLRVAEGNVPYLKKVRSTTKVDVNEGINSPEKIAKMLCDVFDADNLLEEHVWLISFDNRLHVLGFFEISHGTENCSEVSVPAIMRRALLNSAVSFAIAHNHPSGELTPSTEDKAITKKLAEASKIIGLTFIDHLIIGKYGNFYSFREHNTI